MSYANKVNQQRTRNQAVEHERKLTQEIAHHSGVAGAYLRSAETKQISARIPYMAFRDQGVCSVCGQTLAPASNYGVIPHTPKTCPGPAAKTLQGLPTK